MSANTDTVKHAVREAALANINRVVIKVGSKLLHESPAGRPAALADELVALRAERHLEFVVVSSGAISMGMRAMGLDQRPHELPALQAAAAVGQGKLMRHWEHGFAAHGVIIGQVLLTHDDIKDRQRFLNARRALNALIAAGVVPIINENDTVAVDEIKYGDNDLLATMVCNLTSADALIMLTDVNGVHDGRGERIPIVHNVDTEAAPVAGAAKAGGVGSGGMASKVQAAKGATRSGVTTAIVPGREARVIQRVLSGDDIGTLFIPGEQRMTSRKHWIAYGAKPAGTLVVDDGAALALQTNGRSLLPAGIVKVVGSFELGDIVSLVGPSGTEFARGLAGYRAEDVRRIMGAQSADIEATLGYKYLDAVIHRDDLVVL